MYNLQKKYSGILPEGDITRGSLAHEQAPSQNGQPRGQYKIYEVNQTKLAILVGKMTESTWQNVHGDGTKARVSSDDCYKLFFCNGVHFLQLLSRRGIL